MRGAVSFPIRATSCHFCMDASVRLSLVTASGVLTGPGACEWWRRSTRYTSDWDANLIH